MRPSLIVVAMLSFAGCLSLDDAELSEDTSELAADPGGGVVDPGGPYVTRIDAIDNLTCASYSTGMLKCAGAIGSTNAYTPLSMTNVIGARRGTYRAYVQSDGSVRSVASATSRPVVHVTGGAVDVSSGSQHSCALVGSSVKCWGSNSGGQLGVTGSPTGTVDVPNTGSIVAIRAVAAKTFVQQASGSLVELVGTQRPTRSGGGNPFSASFSHRCSIWSGGTVYCACTGNHLYGQCGNTIGLGDYEGYVSGISSAVEIALGSSTSCVRLGTGVVKCWGNNEHGQLGIGGGTSSATPVTVPLARPAIQISAGGDHVCALLQDLSVWCWGGNYHGEMGTGSHLITQPSPARSSF